MSWRTTPRKLKRGGAGCLANAERMVAAGVTHSTAWLAEIEQDGECSLNHVVFKNWMKDAPLGVKDLCKSNYQAPFDLDSCRTAISQHGRYGSGMAVSGLNWLATISPGVPINKNMVNVSMEQYLKDVSVFPCTMVAAILTKTKISKMGSLSWF